MLRPLGALVSSLRRQIKSEGCGSPRFFMIQIKKTGGTKPPAQMSKPSETEREEVWVSW